jgi:hypothetical protein
MNPSAHILAAQEMFANGGIMYLVTVTPARLKRMQINLRNNARRRNLDYRILDYKAKRGDTIIIKPR